MDAFFSSFCLQELRGWFVIGDGGICLLDLGSWIGEFYEIDRCDGIAGMERNGRDKGNDRWKRSRRGSRILFYQMLKGVYWWLLWNMNDSVNDKLRQESC